MDAVVNRDHGLRRRERRKNVMRRVEEVETLAPDREWNRDLLRDRIVRGTVRNSTKVFSERRGHAHILRSGEHYIFILPIDFGKLSEQIPNVGADTEIVKLSGVDANAHGVILVVSRQSLVVSLSRQSQSSVVGLSRQSLVSP